MTVTAPDDALAEGTRFINIQHILSQGSSPDDGGAYDGLAVPGVVVEVVDDDAADVTIVSVTPVGDEGTADDGTLISENASGDLPASDRYAVLLSKQPLGDVRIAVSVDGEGRVQRPAGATIDPLCPTGTPSSLVLCFTTSNWNVPAVRRRARERRRREGGAALRARHARPDVRLRRLLRPRRRRRRARPREPGRRRPRHALRRDGLGLDDHDHRPGLHDRPRLDVRQRDDHRHEGLHRPADRDDRGRADRRRRLHADARHAQLPLHRRGRRPRRRRRGGSRRGDRARLDVQCDERRRRRDAQQHRRRPVHRHGDDRRRERRRLRRVDGDARWHAGDEPLRRRRRSRSPCPRAPRSRPARCGR